VPSNGAQRLIIAPPKGHRRKHQDMRNIKADLDKIKGENPNWSKWPPRPVPPDGRAARGRSPAALRPHGAQKKRGTREASC
jgi:hypothetical protein